jgi:hypothetical protein
MLKNRNSSLLDRYAGKEDLIFKSKNDKDTLLLLDKPKENLEILRTIGLNEHIDKVSQEVNVKNSKKQSAILFNKPAFLGSDIKKLCNEYDLVISRASNYKGSPFEGLPEIIQNFIAEHNYKSIIPAKMETRKVYKKSSDGNFEKDRFGDPIQIEEEYEVKPSKTVIKSKIKTGVSNWFIMAPRESFDGSKKNNCCTLFYRENDDSRYISENDVFLEIHSWGKSYSDIRKYNYFLTNIDYQKEYTIRDKSYNSEKVINKNISFYFIMILILLTTWLYSFGYIAPVIIQSLLFFVLYFIIRKPAECYKELWKI